MTDSVREAAFQALIELARRYPDWRIGQLVANVAGWADADVWDAEDVQLLAAAQTHLQAPDEPAFLAEQSLASDWSRPEEDAAWNHLQPPK